MFFWNAFAFSMIQLMLAIWSLVLLPLQYPACTSGSSQFMYCWSMTWRILNINLKERVQVYSSLNILSHCPSFELKWTHSFSSPVATGEFFLICWYIRCSTLTATSFRILISSSEISSAPLALFVISFAKAHLTNRPYHTLLGLHEFSIISWVASLKAFEFKIPLYSVPAAGHCTSPNMSRSKYMSIIYMSNTLSKTHVWVSPCRQKIHFLGLFSFHTCQTVCSYT